MGVFAEAEKVMRSDRFTNNVLNVAAPTGYGLGGAPTKTIADFNTAVANGCYLFNTNTENKPVNASGIVEVVGIGTMGACRQTAYSSNATSAGLVVYERFGFGSSWGDWYDARPLMRSNYEYKTGELYLNKPVYTKVVAVGYLPAANGVKDVTFFGDPDDTTARGISVVATAGGGQYSLGDIGYSAEIHECNNIRITGGATDKSSLTCYAIVKYHKTTDG